MMIPREQYPELQELWEAYLRKGLPNSVEKSPNVVAATCRNTIMAISRNGLKSAVTYLEAELKSSTLNKLATLILQIIEDCGHNTLKEAVIAQKRLRMFQMIIGGDHRLSGGAFFHR